MVRRRGIQAVLIFRLSRAWILRPLPLYPVVHLALVWAWETYIARFLDIHRFHHRRQQQMVQGSVVGLAHIRNRRRLHIRALLLSGLSQSQCLMAPLLLAHRRAHRYHQCQLVGLAALA